jgi:hypothetical protein
MCLRQTYWHTYLHTYIHTYIHTSCIHTLSEGCSKGETTIGAFSGDLLFVAREILLSAGAGLLCVYIVYLCMYVYIQKYIHIHNHSYTPSYIHANINAFIHTYIHTYFDRWQAPRL